MKHERFSRTAAAWALALILVPLWGGRAQAGFFTALAQFEGQSNSTEPVSVSTTFGLGNNGAAGFASAAASATHGSATAFTQKQVFSGFVDTTNIRGDASFTINDLVFTGAAPGQQFNASLNYGLSGGLDLSGMNTTGGVNVSLRVASFFIPNFHDAGSFSATHSLANGDLVENGVWQINRSGTLSSFATGPGEVTAAGGNTTTPTLIASDEFLLTSSSFLLVADSSGVVGSPAITLSLTSGVGGPLFRLHPASSTSDSALSFASSGPVFNLPDGITVNSVDGLIVDNQWTGGPSQVNPVPEPSSLVLLGIGALALLRGARRPTRSLRAVRAQ